MLPQPADFEENNDIRTSSKKKKNNKKLLESEVQMFAAGVDEV